LQKIGFGKTFFRKQPLQSERVSQFGPILDVFMSADEILAANLWPWPDPLLKRDRNGQVVFVNAAFLQLYGGRIEDWRGNAITGWPAPATQGAQRFETRAGDLPHETVFDWVEMVMADGNAMAIARNVTALIPAPTPPANVALPPLQAQEPMVAQAPQQVPQQAPVAANIPEPAPVAPTAPIAPPPVTQPPAPVIAEAPAQELTPTFETPEVEAPVAEAPDLDATFEETLNRNADDYLDNTPSAAEAEPPADTPTPEPSLEAEPAPEPEKSRIFESRALPIEDSTAVLGSNWRDQVIAKAIGADNAEETPEPSIQPIADEQNSEDAGSNSENSGKTGTGLKILLAEDNAINALLTRTLLEAEGAIVDTVEDGALAVEAVKKETYDLIFMDMRMPNMDGLESTRKIRALGGAFATMPIIALTANAFDDDRNACFDSGMNDFMTKPVSAEELEEMVTNWTKKDAEKLAS
jgi:CheY-like chemotaxis protein